MLQSGMTKRWFSLFLIFQLAAMSGLEAGRQHYFIFVGEGNIEKLRPELFFIPKVQKSEVLRGDQIFWSKSMERNLTLRGLDKWWTAEGEDKPAGGASGNGFKRMLMNIRNEAPMTACDTVVLFWMQGETDAKLRYGGSYQNAFERFVARLEAELGLGPIDVVITRLNDYDMEGKVYPDWVRVRDAQVQLAADHDGWEVIDTDALNGPNNALKFTTKGLEKLCENYAEWAVFFASQQ
jgi:hypothetical protein